MSTITTVTSCLINVRPEAGKNSFLTHFAVTFVLYLMLFVVSCAINQIHQILQELSRHGHLLNAVMNNSFQEFAHLIASSKAVLIVDHIINIDFYVCSFKTQPWILTS